MQCLTDSTLLGWLDGQFYKNRIECVGANAVFGWWKWAERDMCVSSWLKLCILCGANCAGGEVVDNREGRIGNAVSTTLCMTSLCLINLILLWAHCVLWLWLVQNRESILYSASIRVYVGCEFVAEWTKSVISFISEIFLAIVWVTTCVLFLKEWILLYRSFDKNSAKQILHFEFS